MTSFLTGVAALAFVGTVCAAPPVPKTYPTPVYIGCLSEDSDANRDLEGPNDKSGTHGSIEMCAYYCYDLNRKTISAGVTEPWKYFGLQFGKECFCGDSFGRKGIPDAACSTACELDPTQTCGGTHQNSVYSLRPDVPPRPQHTYLGCYVDTNVRDLAVFADPTPSEAWASVEACAIYCYDVKRITGEEYLYFGLQVGQECRCDNSFGDYGKAADTECTSPCLKKASEKCGGRWRNSIYSLIPPTDVPPTAVPTDVPTDVPTSVPTSVPTDVPTAVPTAIPTSVPTAVPTDVPTSAPTAVPTSVPTSVP
eukprot:Rhum_TRINITY_DN13656_c0_g1::Rhum_TRINITY_DN13656_c0_g1_i2::g.62438::m.62438